MPLYYNCLLCHTTIPAENRISHDIVEHGGLQRVRDAHTNLCAHIADIEGKPVECICGLSEYETAVASLKMLQEEDN